MENYDLNRMILASNGVKFETIVSSTIKEAPHNSWGTSGIGTPTVIEIQHSEENNGTLIASFAIFDSGLREGKSTSFRIMESTDGGENWEQISEVYETIDKGIEASWNPHLFELPEQVGNMPKGTLLLAGGSIDPGQKMKSHITIWRSYDCGLTWNQFTVVAEGGGLYAVDSSTRVDAGVWEPYLFYENGYLYCVYSDDTGDKINTPDQKIVYKRSNDGITWEDSTDIVVADQKHYRPGMGIIAKMGDGNFFIVYEIFGDWIACPLYYKITDNIADWNPSNIGEEIKAIDGYTMGGAPWCAWTPAGGKCGTLIVTGKYGKSQPNKLFVSFDCGKTFEVIDNPIPYSDSCIMGGYSSSLFFSKDGSTLFYSTAVENSGGKAKIVFKKIKIHE